MSPVRVTALLGVALLLAAMAAMASASDGRAFAWLTGECFHQPAPLVCHRGNTVIVRRGYDV